METEHTGGFETFEIVHIKDIHGQFGQIHFPTVTNTLCNLEKVVVCVCVCVDIGVGPSSDRPTKYEQEKETNFSVFQ